jgi:hypothetical protein
MRTYWGEHSDRLASVGADTGILVGIHSCSSLKMIVPRAVADSSGTGMKFWPGVKAAGHGLGLGVGVGVGDAWPRAGRAGINITMKATRTAISQRWLFGIRAGETFLEPEDVN